MAKRYNGTYHPRGHLRGDSSLNLLIIVTLLASAGGWYYLQQQAAAPSAPLTAAPATTPASVSSAEPTSSDSKVASHSLRQCVDASGKILWSDQPCPQHSQALALNPNAGTTYSSAESMRPTANMPPVYVPPPHSVAGGDVVVVGGDSAAAAAPTPTYSGSHTVVYCCRPSPAYTVIAPHVHYGPGQPSQSMSAHVPTRNIRPFNDLHY